MGIDSTRLNKDYELQRQGQLDDRKKKTEYQYNDGADSMLNKLKGMSADQLQLILPKLKRQDLVSYVQQLIDFKRNNHEEEGQVKLDPRQAAMQGGSSNKGKHAQVYEKGLAQISNDPYAIMDLSDQVGMQDNDVGMRAVNGKARIQALTNQVRADRANFNARVSFHNPIDPTQDNAREKILKRSSSIAAA